MDTRPRSRRTAWSSSGWSDSSDPRGTDGRASPGSELDRSASEQSLELLQVAQRVPGEGAKRRVDRLLAATGMEADPGELLGREAAPQREVPLPRGEERLERASGVRRIVEAHPRDLVELLHPVVRLGEHLAGAEADRDLGVGHVDEHLCTG